MTFLWPTLSLVTTVGLVTSPVIASMRSTGFRRCHPLPLSRCGLCDWGIVTEILRCQLVQFQQRYRLLSFVFLIVTWSFWGPDMAARLNQIGCCELESWMVRLRTALHLRSSNCLFPATKYRLSGLDNGELWTVPSTLGSQWVRLSLLLRVRSLGCWNALLAWFIHYSVSQSFSAIQSWFFLVEKPGASSQV